LPGAVPGMKADEPTNLSGTSASASGRRPLFLATLQELAAQALRTPPSSLPPDRPLTALGLDSLAAVELQQAIETELGVALPLDALFEDVTLEQLADHLVEQRAGGVAAAWTDGAPAWTDAAAQADHASHRTDHEAAQADHASHRTDHEAARADHASHRTDDAAARADDATQAAGSAVA